MTQCPRHFNVRYGFTLVELLVVIAIIALLLAILLPSLTKVREMGLQTVCMTRLRTLSTASLLYSQDNRDQLPMAGSRNSYGYLTGQYPFAPYWDIRLLPYLGIKSIDIKYDSRGTAVPDNSGFMSQKKALEVFLCPASAARNLAAVKILYAAKMIPRSYRINGMVSGIVLDSAGNMNYTDSYTAGSTKISSVKQTGRTVYIACSMMDYGVAFNTGSGWCARYWGDIVPSHFVKTGAPFVSWWGSDHERFGRSSFSFVDFHCETFKMQYTKVGSWLPPGSKNNPDAVKGIKLTRDLDW